MHVHSFVFSNVLKCIISDRKKLKVVTELANNGLPPLPIPEECYQYKRPLTYPEVCVILFFKPPKNCTIIGTCIRYMYLSVSMREFNYRKTSAFAIVSSNHPVFCGVPQG